MAADDNRSARWLRRAGASVYIAFLVMAAGCAWDFAPRNLPALLIDLPVACMIFDGVIGAYLSWMVASRRTVSPHLESSQFGSPLPQGHP
jgi:hypothetical protein